MRTRRGSRALGAGLGTGAAIVLLAALLALLPGAAASDYAPGQPVEWTNGLVLCEFAGALPLVSVSSLNISGSGLTASLAGMQEVAPNGTVSATAEASAAHWTLTNRSDEDSFVLDYSAGMTIANGTGSGPPIGLVDVNMTVALPAYAGSPDGPTDTVSVVLGVGPWTSWVSGDHLVLTLSAAPSYPGSEYLSASAPSGWILSTLANQTGSERERLAVNSTATFLAYSGLGPAVSPVNASLDLRSPEQAAVAVSFPAQAGSSLAPFEYGAHVAVVLPPSVAGIPLSELAGAAAAAALVSVLVAVSVRRVRARPSRLIYADEEDR